MQTSGGNEGFKSNDHLFFPSNNKMSLDRGGINISVDVLLSNIRDAMRTGGSAGSGGSHRYGRTGSFPSLVDSICGWCNRRASSCCFDCNEILCDYCTVQHGLNAFKHRVVAFTMISPPIGSAGGVIRSGGSGGWPGAGVFLEPHCDMHGEVLSYWCEPCKQYVCQECTLLDHEDHSCIPVPSSVRYDAKIRSILESGKLSTQHIKTSIEQTATYSQSVEQNAMEASAEIRNAMRRFKQAVEDREQTLLYQVDQFRWQKQASLSNQMVGLQAVLDGVSQTLNMLTMGSVDIANKLTTGERLMEQFVADYKNLQSKQESIKVAAPNFKLLGQIRMQGDVMIVDQRSGWVSSNGSSVAGTSCLQGGPPGGSIGSGVLGSGNDGGGPSLTFGSHGPEDGQVSRPCGITVNKDGHILVADRYNHRVQIFYSNGTFKLTFGSKGSGDGQFNLPVGICTDGRGRIIVADKDNHRVQVFSPGGKYLRQFGSHGKKTGEFRYPWDVAVNMKNEILVTDMQNNRVQLFRPDGWFILQFSFADINHNQLSPTSRTPSPRGACFTPQGNIIITDIENNQLLLIDATLSTVLDSKVHRGSAVDKFMHPSAICCGDDGRVFVADCKNHRVFIFSPQLEFLSEIKIRPSWMDGMLAVGLNEKNGPCGVALLPDGRLVVTIGASWNDLKCIQQKTFINIYSCVPMM